MTAALTPGCRSARRGAAGPDRVPHPAVLRRRRPRDHRRRVRRPGRRAGRPSRTAHPELARPDSPIRRGRRGAVAAVRRGPAPHADDVARQDDQLRGAAGLGQADGPLHLRRGGLHLRAQDRRAGHEPAVRGRPADAGPPPAATARSARTSRPTCAPSRPSPSELAGAGARRGRGAGRDLHADPGLRGAQPTPGGDGGPDVHQPPQRRRPGRCARRTRPSRPAGSWGSGPTSWGRSRAARSFAEHTPDPRVDARGGLPGQSQHRAGARPRRGRRVLPDTGSTGATPCLRDRRHGGQGRRPGPAPRAGRHVEGAPVGHRLQVPARGEDHPAQGDHGLDRPDRQGHALRHARAGRGGRRQGRRWPPCTTRTRCASRTSARATPWWCAGPATSSPRCGARCCPCARPDSEPWTFPTDCPVCGEPLVRLEGESDTFCVNVDCPGQQVQRISHFASRGAMDIEHLGERTVYQFCQAGLLHDVADIYDLDYDRIAPFEGWGETSVANLQPGHRGVQVPPAGQPAGRAVDPPSGRRPAAGCWPATSGHLDRIMAAPGRRDGRRGGGRAGHRGQRASSSSPCDATAEVVERLRPAGLQLRRARTPPTSRRSWPASRSS